MPIGRIDNKTQIDAVFTDKKDNAQLDPQDFMNLLITQMKNQDFTSPMDNSEMLNQMATFSNMQMMQDMATYSKTSYAMSMVGKNVTASRFTVGGGLDTTTGKVEKVSLLNNEYVLFVGGKKYSLEQVMSVEEPKEEDNKSLVDPKKFPLEMTDVTEKSAKLTWKVPTEDEIIAKDLSYTVYYSKEKDFDSVEAVEKGKLVGEKDAKKVTSAVLEELEADTTYYVNVVVKDKNGVKTVYNPHEFKTLR